MKIKLMLASLVMASQLNSVQAKDLPPAFEAVYRVEKAGMTLGEVTISLHYNGNSYEYRKHTTTKGLLALFRKDQISEVSTGTIHNGRIEAERYEYRHKRGSKVRSSTLAFMQDGRVTGAYKDRPFEVITNLKLLDRASVELALMRDVGPESLDYAIIDRGKQNHYVFQAQGKRTVDSPAGEFECIQYQVKRNVNKERSTSLCLSPKLHNLPIYAEHDEKGTTLDMHLLHYKTLIAPDSQLFRNAGTPPQLASNP